MTRVGTGFDAHRLVAGRSLILGGIDIPHDRGLDGHSDADVLTHAIMDALLGAIGDGDIGRHFPDSDTRWQGACSLDLLRQVAGHVAKAGGQINNIDATVIAEQPKLAPHISSIRNALANCLELPLHNVSIKATTVESMGALGRQEGIAAMAVCAIELNPLQQGDETTS